MKAKEDSNRKTNLSERKKRKGGQIMTLVLGIFIGIAFLIVSTVVTIVKSDKDTALKILGILMVIITIVGFIILPLALH